MTTVALVAAGVHLAFIGVFAWAAVWPLAGANVASVLVYVLAYRLVRGEHPLLAVWLMALEVLGHSTAAVLAIGWDSGFHFYIMLIIPVVIVSALTSVQRKVAFAFAVGVFYVLLDWHFRQQAPVFSLAGPVLLALHYFNLVSMLLLLGLLCTVYFRMVKEAQRLLHVQASTDPLTQLFNRRAMRDMVQRECVREVLADDVHTLALLLVDVDHFKRINDRHGHESGDDALLLIAQTLQDGLREGDQVARWGGEEFLVMLPATGVDEAVKVAERLRQRVAAQRFMGAAGRQPLSVTLGVAVRLPHESIDRTLARADQALYMGKESGRNRVVLAPEPEITTQN